MIAVRERTGPACATCPAELLIVRVGRVQCERCRLDGIPAPALTVAAPVSGRLAPLPRFHDRCVRCGSPVHRLLAVSGFCRDCTMIHVFGTLHPGREVPRG